MREFLNELKNGDGNEGSESAADTATPRSLFDFDVSYEIECECDDPEQAKLMLEDMLRTGDWPFVQAHQMAVFAMNCCDMICQNRHDLASDVCRVLEPLGVSVDYPHSELRAKWVNQDILAKMNTENGSNGLKEFNYSKIGFDLRKTGRSNWFSQPSEGPVHDSSVVADNSGKNVQPPSKLHNFAQTAFSEVEPGVLVFLIENQ
ncbi:hypothetical protein Tco_0678773 [Tanacetum coccineum]|uniref:Uncharacterized protein n=1 Tax=Tanacetum coccineum TaxID=301880 RepID=A0ABQ4XG03_9ASTR